ncbi:MAG TPA: GGDEF domain-containing protein [Candidatus Paceibacterota bacterium]|nr:GGDEF domain-containing protein [Candidatus Paceibacterota bacterium]
MFNKHGLTLEDALATLHLKIEKTAGISANDRAELLADWEKVHRLTCFYLSEMVIRVHKTFMRLERQASAARFDSMTKLLNYRSLMHEITRFFVTDRRCFGWSAIGFVDMRYFKLINDTYGHSTGNAAIKAVAAILRQCLRAGDLVCRQQKYPWNMSGRIGGDEFSFFLPNVAGPRSALEVGNRLQALAKQYDWKSLGIEYGPRLDVGVICIMRRHDRPYEMPAKEIAEKLLASADAMMYRSKNAAKQQGIETVEMECFEMCGGTLAPIPREENAQAAAAGTSR